MVGEWHRMRVGTLPLMGCLTMRHNLGQHTDAPKDVRQRTKGHRYGKRREEAQGHK